jgi:hypothetical protein
MKEWLINVGHSFLIANANLKVQVPKCKLQIQKCKLQIEK